jgi:hypothetical protein
MKTKFLTRAASCGAVLALFASSGLALADEADPGPQQGPGGEEQGPEGGAPPPMMDPGGYAQNPCLPAGLEAPPPAFGGGDIVIPCRTITVPGMIYRAPRFGVATIPTPDIHVPVLVEPGGMQTLPCPDASCAAFGPMQGPPPGAGPEQGPPQAEGPESEEGPR